MEVFAFIIAIAIVLLAIVAMGVIYWLITKEFILFTAKYLKDLDFKNEARVRGVKQTEEEKAYLKKKLFHMLIFASVCTGLFMKFMLSNIDFTYYELYPIKTLITVPELRDASMIIVFPGAIFIFLSAFMVYPYKILILMLAPGVKYPWYYR